MVLMKSAVNAAQASGWVAAASALVLFVGVHALESYVLTPIIQRQALDIPPDCVEMMGDTAVAFTRLDFAQELAVSLRRYWKGLPVRA